MNEGRPRRKAWAAFFPGAGEASQSRNSFKITP